MARRVRQPSTAPGHALAAREPSWRSPRCRVRTCSSRIGARFDDWVTGALTSFALKASGHPRGYRDPAEIGGQSRARTIPIRSGTRNWRWPSRSSMPPERGVHAAGRAGDYEGLVGDLQRPSRGALPCLGNDDPRQRRAGLSTSCPGWGDCQTGRKRATPRAWVTRPGCGPLQFIRPRANSSAPGSAPARPSAPWLWKPVRPWRAKVGRPGSHGLGNSMAMCCS